MLDRTQAKGRPRSKRVVPSWPDTATPRATSGSARPRRRAFPDGAHFRVEVPTVNSADAVRTLVRIVEEEAGVKINRIDQTAGIMRFSDAEHEAYLDVGRENDIEIFFALGPRGIYDIGAQKMIQLRVGPRVGAAHARHGADRLRHWRTSSASSRMGGRGLLISDEGMLILAHKMRCDGVIPPDVKLMASAHMGHNNPVTYRMLEELGADTIASQARPRLLHPRGAARRGAHPAARAHRQPAGDRRLPCVSTDAPEMIRICAPVLLKTGSSVLERHGMVITEELAIAMARQVAVSMETIRRYMPEAVADHGPGGGSRDSGLTHDHRSGEIGPRPGGRPIRRPVPSTIRRRH